MDALNDLAPLLVVLLPVAIEIWLSEETIRGKASDAAKYLDDIE